MPFWSKSTPRIARAPDRRRARGAAAFFICITIVLDISAVGMIIPVLPRLIQTLGGGGSAQVARTFGLFVTVFSIMQFLAQPIQGALSDRFGRRPVILASNFGLGLDYLVMALAPSLPWLFAGRLLAGAAAGSITAASAYMADITPPEERAAGFGQIYGAISLGITVGPLLGGALSLIDLRAPFWAAAALSLMNAVYGLFVLPESLKLADKAPIVLAQLNPLGSLLYLVRRYPALLAMAAVMLLSGVAWQGVNTLMVVYTTYRYAWKPVDVAILLTVLGGLNFIVQTRLIKVSVQRIGERMTALCGMGLQAVSLVIFAVAASGIVFWIAVPFLCLGTIGGPAWQSLVSNRVSSSEQGRLAGAFNGMFSIAGIIAPVAFTGAFAMAVNSGERGLWLGSPFLVGTAATLLAIALAAWATRRTSSG